jgi:hypothetical protein
MITGMMTIQAQNAAITNVTHGPEVPTSGETVDVTLRLEDASNVTLISIIVCTIEPFVCEMPESMTQSTSDSNTFTYPITKTYDPGIKMGFKFKIKFDDTTTQDFPKTAADSSYHPIDGPFEGFYYFVYTLESESTQGSTLIIIMAVVLIVAFIPLILAAILLSRKRKERERKKKREEELEIKD